MFLRLFIIIGFCGVILGENYSLSFDGVDDYVEIADSDELDGMEQLTVQFWANLSEYSLDASMGTNFIMKTEHPSDYNSYSFYTAGDENRLTFRVMTISGSAGADLFNYSDHVNLNEWHLFTGVYDGQNIQLYIDGVLMVEDDLSGTVIQNEYPVTIANINNPASTKNYYGKMDALSIWDTALSLSDIQLYLSSSPEGIEENLIGYWDFNEGSGNVLTDVSGSGNNGVIYGASWSDGVSPLPNIAVSPDSLVQQLYMGDSIEQILTIYNNGEADLIWDLGFSSFRDSNEEFTLPEMFRNDMLYSESGSTGEEYYTDDNVDFNYAANSDRDGLYDILVYNNSTIANIINEHSELSATSVQYPNAETLEDVDVLFNIRKNNEQPEATLEWIYNGGTWVGEWSSNDYPISSWGVIGGSVNGGSCCTQSISILDQGHWLAQNIDWDNIPIGAGPTQFQRNITINDSEASVIVSSYHSAYGEIPLIVEKSYGNGTIILFNWDYQDSPNNYNGVPEMIRQMAYYAAAISGGVNWISFSETSGVVSPGSSQNIQLELNTLDLDAGTYDTEIFIHSNDLDQASLGIPVQLTVEIPYPEIEISPLSFDEVLFVGDSIERSLTISNSGVATLDWNLNFYDYGRDGTSYTFTNCGKEGHLGPSQSECDVEYQGTSLQEMVDVTDGIQEWTVPQTGHYTIEALGAQGGAGTTNGGVDGGLGARMKGEFYLSAGSQLYILIGQQADGISRGGSNAGGGGGGGTFVVLDSNTPLLVAGGGGGTGANSGVINTNTHGQSGESGGISSQNSSVSQDGEGGYSGYDGAGGGGFYGNGINSESVGLGGSSFINGGIGGLFGQDCGYPCGSHMGYGGFGGGGGVGHAGGGGGGYSGGNGTGQWGNGSWTGGGGSFNVGQNQENQSGINSGHGLVIITPNSLITPWAELSEAYGSISVGQSDTIEVEFNASELEFGTYSAGIRVISNDEDESIIDIPLSLTVYDDVTITDIDDASINEDSQLNLFLSNNYTAYDYIYSANTDTSAVVAFIENDTLRLIPQLDWTGVVSVSVTLTLENYLSDTTEFILTVLPVNDPPNAYNEVFYVNEDDTLYAVLPADDGDFLDGVYDSQNLTFSALDGFLNGSYSIDGSSGQMTYIPNADYFGADSMVFMVVDDGITGNETYPLSDSAMIIVQTLPVNDSPVIGSISDTSMYEDSTLMLEISVSDVDNSDITLSVSTSDPEFGSIEITDTLLTINPVPDWNDTLMLTVTANDNMDRAIDTEDFHLIVLPVNDPPNAYNEVFYVNEDDTLYAVLPADDGDFLDGVYDSQNLTFSALDGFLNGSYSIDGSSGQMTYIPNADYFGADSMVFMVVDDGITGNETYPLSDSAMIIVQTLPVNDSPVIGSISDTSMYEDSTLMLEISVSDVDNSDITLSAHITNSDYLSINIEDTFIHINSYFNWNGSVIVTIIANDNMDRAIDIEEFQLIVLPVNDPPEFGELNELVGVGMNFNLPIVAYDIDMDTLDIIFDTTWNYPDWIIIEDDPFRLVGSAPDEGNFNFPLILTDGFETIVDTFNLSAQYFHPRITAIDDVPEDEGGRVYIHFQRSFFDQTEQTNQFYSVYRLDNLSDSLIWVGVGTASATGMEEYTLEVSTIRDSTNEHNGLTEFKVLAFTDSGTFHSDPMNGYSIDNIAPDTPGSFTVAIIEQGIQLNWEESNAADFEIFNLEKSLSESFAELDLIILTETSYLDTSYALNENYYYRLSALDHSGNSSEYTEIVSAILLSIDEDLIPDDFALYQNFPNPFNPVTTIRFDIPEQSHVLIQIFDVQGRKVNTIINETINPGKQHALWDATNDIGEPVSAGMYFYLIKAGDYTKTRKMILLK